MQSVSIIVIAHDVLQGLTLDVNSHWLCEFITGIGGRVRRVVQVSDDPQAIIDEMNVCRTAGDRLIFTIGGLGPTADDVTLSAVSAALGLPMEKNAEALKMVSAAYREMHRNRHAESEELTDSRLKMAILPRGGHPLVNPIGVAPGVVLQAASSVEPADTVEPWEPTASGRFSSSNLLIVCLPGVPREMKAVVESSLAGELAARFGNAAYMREDFSSECRDESVLAGTLSELRAQFPRVFIKSHAERHSDSEVEIRLSVSCAAGSWEETRELMAKATAKLSAKLAKQGILLHSLTQHEEQPVS